MVSNEFAIAIMAAGKGTRLKSKHPKVLHEIGGRALLLYGAGDAVEGFSASLSQIERDRRQTIRSLPVSTRRATASTAAAKSDRCSATG